MIKKYTKSLYSIYVSSLSHVLVWLDKSLNFVTWEVGRETPAVLSLNTGSCLLFLFLKSNDKQHVTVVLRTNNYYFIKKATIFSNITNIKSTVVHPPTTLHSDGIMQTLWNAQHEISWCSERTLKTQTTQTYGLLLRVLYSVDEPCLNSSCNISYFVLVFLLCSVH